MLVRTSSEKEMQLKLRTKQPSEKDMLFQKVQQIFQDSNTLNEFRLKLQKANIKSYDRNGKLCGIYYGKRRYRIKRSLGIDLSPLMLKDKSKEREQPLRKLRDKQLKNRSKERER